MTETVLMILAMACLCFMATCMLLVFMIYKDRCGKRAAMSEDEIAQNEKYLEEQKKRQEAWEGMMAYTGAPQSKGGDDW